MKGGLEHDAGPGPEDLGLLVDRCRRELALTGRTPELSSVAAIVSVAHAVRGAQATHVLARRVLAALVGFGELDDLLRREDVTDLLVNPDGSVWVEDGAGMRKVRGRALTPETCRRLAVRLISLGGRRLDEAQPFADVVLDGVRVHAVLPPLSTPGPALSLRRMRTNTAHLDSLLSGPHADWVPRLERIVSSRLNFLISGGTGAGKTTLLSAMLARVPHDERMVIVEDAPELRPEHPHAVALHSRAPNTEGAGGIELTALVREALRMRPDRLIVGECRGEEVRDVLMALNTGHDGAGATIHANAADSVGERLIALGALGGWDPRSTALQAAAAIDVVVHVARVNGERRPVSMARLRACDGALRAEEIVRQAGDGTWVEGPGAAWFDSVRGRAG